MLALSIWENIASKATILMCIKYEFLRDYCSYITVSEKKKHDVLKSLFEVEDLEQKPLQNVVALCDGMENRIKSPIIKDQKILHIYLILLGNTIVHLGWFKGLHLAWRWPTSYSVERKM